MTKSTHTFQIGDETVAPGEVKNVSLDVAQTYTGQPVSIRAQVWNSKAPGPTVLVSGAIHGDEINGSGIVREIIRNKPHRLSKGTLVLVPVVNVLGFEQHNRYMPDRRDLNRFFPGKLDGSLTSRFAHAFFDEIVRRCDFVIDLHSAAWTRTNFPNVRADLSAPKVAAFAHSLGCEILVDDKGPKGSLRQEAVRAGVPTVLLEAGEVNKVEPRVVEFGLRLITNGLIGLGMIERKPYAPIYQAVIRRNSWIRAHSGGLLDFHVAPGDVVEKGEPVATNMTLLGEEQSVVNAPYGGIVLGMTTLPAVMPGDPIIHLGQVVGGYKRVAKAIGEASSRTLHERMRSELQTNVYVSERDD
ncbi:MAG TPA: succinylglutamate desuccinylase/aspartoacylase family protein [Fimbriimonadaceae bacterium]|nr:succinylglutamate desuccinylase/aspartoacylase family protein [Fimbriimonadaceae bacterium]